jgi:hypothetical protein
MRATLFTVGGKAPEALLTVTPDGKVQVRKPRKLTKAEAASMGGMARKAKLSPRRRKAIARQAANARWKRTGVGAQCPEGDPMDIKLAMVSCCAETLDTHEAGAP